MKLQDKMYYIEVYNDQTLIEVTHAPTQASFILSGSDALLFQDNWIEAESAGFSLEQHLVFTGLNEKLQFDSKDYVQGYTIDKWIKDSIFNIEVVHLGTNTSMDQTGEAAQDFFELYCHHGFPDIQGNRGEFSEFLHYYGYHEHSEIHLS